jgi:hypothetical protein
VNEVLPPVWTERVTRLRLGIEAIDALGRPGPLGGIGLHLEDGPTPAAVPGGVPAPVPFGDLDDGVGLPGVAASPSGRFALGFGQPLVDAPPNRLVVRIVDRHRRFVPRRLSVPAPTLAAVTTADAAHDADPTVPLAGRVCRPALFPGAAYGEAAGATIVRGRVTWGAGGPRAAWVRVVARTATPIDVVDDEGDVVATIQPVLGRAHGDERGEFLLVIGSLPKELALANEPDVDLEIAISARPEPAANAPVTSPTGSRADPLWHLPIETVGSLDPTDLVAAGVTTPAGFTASTAVPLTVRRGRVTRPSVAFALP